MDENKTIILGIELDTSGLIDAAADAKREMNALKAVQKSLDTSTAEGRIEFEKNAAAIRELNTTYRDTTKLIDNATKSRKAETDSLEQMKATLAIATKQYDLMSGAQRTGTKEGIELQSQIKALSDSLKKNESAIGDNRRNVGNYEESLKGLKKELKDISNQLGGMDAGTEQYRKAALRAGELKDKIKEVNENVKGLAGGSSFEKLGNTFGMLKGDLANLDFAGVSEKAKVLTTISKEMTFAEATGGIKSMGSALLNLGKAILSNPLFLLAGVVIAVVAAIYEFSKAAKSSEEENKALADSIKTVNENIAAQNSLIDYNTKLQIINLKNLGATEEAIAIKQINALKEKQRVAREAYEEAEEQNKSALKRYGEDDELTKKALENSKKLYADYQKSKQDVIIASKEAEAALIKKADDAEIKSHDEAIKKKEDADKKAADRAKENQKIAAENLRKDRKAQIEIDILSDIENSKKWLDDKIRLLRESANQEMQQEHITATQKELIEKTYQLNVKKLTDDTLRAQEDAVKKSLENQLKTLQDHSERQKALNALDFLSKKQAADESFLQGLTTEKQHIKALENIRAEAAKEQKKEELVNLRSQINLMQEGSTERIKLEVQYQQKKQELETESALAERAEIKKTEAQQKASHRAQLQSATQMFAGLASLFDQGSDEYKAFTLLQITASTAQGAMAAFTSAVEAFGALGPEVSIPIGLAAAGIVVAEGAVQSSKVLSLERGGMIYPQAANGMIIGGEPHSRGGTKFHGSDGSFFEAEKDELLAIVNKRSVGMIGKLNALNMMGGGNNFYGNGGLHYLMDGGFASRSVSQPVQDSARSSAKLESALLNLPPQYVLVEDINGAQGKMVRTKSRAEI